MDDEIAGGNQDGKHIIKRLVVVANMADSVKASLKSHR